MYVEHGKSSDRVCSDGYGAGIGRLGTVVLSSWGLDLSLLMSGSTGSGKFPSPSSSISSTMITGRPAVKNFTLYSTLTLHFLGQ